MWNEPRASGESPERKFKNTKLEDATRNVASLVGKFIAGSAAILVFSAAAYLSIYLFVIHQIERDRPGLSMIGLKLGEPDTWPIFGATNRHLTGWIDIVIEKIEITLGPYWLEMLFLTPIFLLTFEAISNVKFNDRVKNFVGFWLGTAFMYGSVYHFTSDNSFFALAVLIAPAIGASSLLNFAITSVTALIEPLRDRCNGATAGSA